jgi:hypothetical protein
MYKKNLTAEQVMKIHEDTYKKNTHVYEIILQRCFRKIEETTKKNIENNYILFEIPAFMLGYPRINIKMCADYLIIKLRKNGFQVNFIEPQNIKVLWNPIEEKLMILDKVIEEKPINKKKYRSVNDANFDNF